MLKPEATDNPWRMLDSRRVYENPWISVREDSVIRPDGEPGIYGVVHYKNTAVGVVPVEDDHVYLVGQYRYPLECYSWEIPEGGCPEGEDTLEAARRELKEETGLEAGSWSKLGEAFLSNSVADEHAVWYLARTSSPASRRTKARRSSACGVFPCGRPWPWRWTVASPTPSAFSPSPPTPSKGWGVTMSPPSRKNRAVS